MKKMIFVSMIISLISSVSFAEWQMNEFMITLWGNPEKVSDEAFIKAVSGAGFNTIIWSSDKLDLCKKYGLKVMVENPTPELAAKVSKHPALWGYYITDEPYPESTFVSLADKFRSLEKADSGHPPFINMLSTTGDFLRTYMDVVKPPILSWDFYQWSWGIDRYYEKLEQFREASLFAGVPLTCCIETNSNPISHKDEDYSSDNLQKLRLSVYSSLAYGLKGIHWFHGSGIFKPGTYELAKNGKDIALLNAELKIIGPELINFRSADVFNTPPLPAGTREAYKEHWIQITGEKNCEGLILGTFKNKNKTSYMEKSETDYFMVVNRDYRNTQQVVVRFHSKWLGIAPWNKPKTISRSVDKFDRVSGKWVQINSSAAVGFIFFIKPGDGELFRVVTKTDI